ncbi:MAG TPA: hypothetical protein VE604_11095 [Candidatus Polarisedimenticolia bacterium]|nr:hypothetical protein [Candidatus Polarisedimenticolia bacterium]
MKTRAVTLILAIILTLGASCSAFAAVAVPNPLSPASGANLTSPLTISWSAVTDPSGILGYNWQVSTSSTFPTVALQNSTNDGITQDTVSGLPNGTYFWRVQAVSGAFVKSAWSATHSFNITGTGAGQPGAPTMSPTKAYSTFHPLEVMTFNWSPVAGAASYVLQFSKDPSFPVTTTSSFNNIPDTTYSFSTPDEGSYSARVYAVNANGVAGVPSNIISYSVFYNNPIGAPPAPLSPANGASLTLPVQLAWTGVANPQPSGYELQIAKDSGFQQIEDDSPQLNNPNRTVLSLTAGQKFWRVRSAQGDSSSTTAAVTAWSAAGSFTISAAPPAPATLALTTNAFYSGNTTWVQIQLSGAAPAAGAVINLTSSNPAAAPVPASVNMPANTAWMQFQIQAGQVTSTTPVTLTATLNSGQATLQFNVLPPSLKSITMNASTISGGAQVGAIAMLNGQAPAGGAVVDFSSDSPSAMPPALATIPAGNASVSISIPTNQVAANTVANISASWNGTTVQSPLTITPQGQPASIALSPASVTGQAGSFATVTVATAATTDQIFQVSSSNPAVAGVSNSVLIPAGSKTGGISINTAPVSAQTLVTISVSGGGVTRSATLTVNPAAASTTMSLGVTAGGRSGERVVSNPAGLNVATGATATGQFAPGTSVTLSVASGRDAIWGGACSSGGAKTRTCTLTLNANSSVTANVQ